MQTISATDRDARSYHEARMPEPLVRAVRAEAVFFIRSCLRFAVNCHEKEKAAAKVLAAAGIVRLADAFR